MVWQEPEYESMGSAGEPPHLKRSTLPKPCLSNKARQFIPSLEMFLTAKMEKEFKKLEGNEQQGKNIVSLAAWPNCFLTHPSLTYYCS
jgi:hypothetical protein